MNNTFTWSPDELYHDGVKGMKWGVRRYQNPDGTLTDLGRKRLVKDLREVNRLDKKIQKINKAQENSASSEERKRLTAYTQELKAKQSQKRTSLEDFGAHNPVKGKTKYSNLSDAAMEYGLKYAEKHSKNAEQYAKAQSKGINKFLRDNGFKTMKQLVSEERNEQSYNFRQRLSYADNILQKYGKKRVGFAGTKSRYALTKYLPIQDS